VKKLLVLLLIVGAVYYFVTERDQLFGPEVIEDRVFAEFRMDVTTHGRTFNFVLIGEAADQTDCNQRSDRLWREVLSGCAECEIKSLNCVEELSSRYTRIWDKQPTHVRYLSLTKGTAGERSGRLITWGVSVKESERLCDQMKKQIEKKYNGALECI